MNRQTSALKFVLVVLCYLKLSSALWSPKNIRNSVKHVSTARLVQPVIGELSETVVSISSTARGGSRGHESLFQLRMSSNSDRGTTSNRKKTITVGVNERMAYGKESTSESGEYIAPVPTEPLVLTLTGRLRSPLISIFYHYDPE